ncbi:GGDEF domain-containing protein [Undibacterium sp.]|jgi:diguanylate cyclase (GGDEF)-like protein|uniref:GGDEF domain-containing protein n=1 Tax=Undibacterium sp. TaxID=1914977 RepID=UPI002B8111D9|nr:GGDEF domain-containing protein [Undibacterium sp.]HTD05363.1 GGDEF domain-containing protein [Undibacterium sp.]
MHFGNTDYKLSSIHLFRDISEDNLAVIGNIISQCEVVTARAGQVVLDVHSSGARLYIVLKGALGITKMELGLDNTNLLENAITQYLPGECVGEISVLDEEIHSATIAAISDSELLVIEAETMWRLIDESNGVARNLLQLLSFRIRAANAQIRNRQKVGEFYRQMSMIDGLTGLHNRAWLNNQLPGLIDSALASATPISIIMVDLDHFKRFNDEHGHLLGDDALQSAAKVLNAGLRPSDFAARYGGEEMMVILPNTNQQSALIVAERLCTRLRKTRVFPDMQKPLPHITASFGLATLTEGQDGKTLVAAADAALYRAKEAGRNQVAI